MTPGAAAWVAGLAADAGGGDPVMGAVLLFCAAVVIPWCAVSAYVVPIVVWDALTELADWWADRPATRERVKRRAEHRRRLAAAQAPSSPPPSFEGWRPPPPGWRGQWPAPGARPAPMSEGKPAPPPRGNPGQKLRYPAPPHAA